MCSVKDLFGKTCSENIHPGQFQKIIINHNEGVYFSESCRFLTCNFLKNALLRPLFSCLRLEIYRKDIFRTHLTRCFRVICKCEGVIQSLRKVSRYNVRVHFYFIITSLHLSNRWIEPIKSQRRQNLFHPLMQWSPTISRYHVISYNEST